MGNYGPNRQLRTFHSLFTAKRDHKAVPRWNGGGNLGGAYICEVCGEMLERNGRRHQYRYVGRQEVTK